MEEKLTQGTIHSIGDLSKNTFFGNYMSYYKEIAQYKYILVIQSLTQKCMKLTIYPLQDKNVIKLTVYGEHIVKEDKGISDENLSQVLELLSGFLILHTSGLTLKKESLLFECYVKIDLSNTKNFSYKRRIKGFIDNLDLKSKIERVKMV